MFLNVSEEILSNETKSRKPSVRKICYTTQKGYLPLPSVLSKDFYSTEGKIIVMIKKYFLGDSE